MEAPMEAASPCRHPVNAQCLQEILPSPWRMGLKLKFYKRDALKLFSQLRTTEKLVLYWHSFISFITHHCCCHWPFVVSIYSHAHAGQLVMLVSWPGFIKAQPPRYLLQKKFSVQKVWSSTGSRRAALSRKVVWLNCSPPSFFLFDVRSILGFPLSTVATAAPACAVPLLRSFFGLCVETAASRKGKKCQFFSGDRRNVSFHECFDAWLSCKSFRVVN